MKSVLLIDSDPEFCKMVKRWLLGAGWRVLEAMDGEGGVAQALDQQPDAVICDLLMPKFNGFQICRSIRSRTTKIRQPLIIATTRSGYSSNRQSAIESGADACLVKPFGQRELLGLLESTGLYQEPVSARKPSAPVEIPMVIPADEPPVVRFWGVRGSIPTPGPSTVEFGGNTSCVEVRADGEIIVLDAGSGIRRLGLSLSREFNGKPLKLTVLITHTHWDHIQGFPFFIPAYDPENKVQILGYEGARKGLLGTLSSQMESPYFPVSMREMPSNIHVSELKESEFRIGNVKVQTAFMNHPGICVGYRLTTSRGSIVYMPDHEPFQRMRSHQGTKSPDLKLEALKFAHEQDQKIVEFMRDADLLIIDSQYDEAEYRTHVGWGHGCVDDVVALALFAKVKRLILFHHDPDHSDAQIYRMETWAREIVKFHGETMAVDAAREGVEYVLRRGTGNTTRIERLQTPAVP